METKIPNLRKLVAKEAPECPVDNLTDDMVLAVAKGLKVKPEFQAKAGEENKNPRPGVLYVAGPMLKGSDGKDVRGAYIEVGALRPMIDQLISIENKLRDGEIDLPAGYQLEFAEDGELLRARGGLEGWTPSTE